MQKPCSDSPNQKEWKLGLVSLLFGSSPFVKLLHIWQDSSKGDRLTKIEESRKMGTGSSYLYASFQYSHELLNTIGQDRERFVVKLF